MARRKLLLADDSITIQKVVNLTFADEGIDVVTVGDGEAALTHLAAETPDILLADVNMPGPNGYQICEQLRANEATRGVPVILLVGSFEPFDEAEATRVGANAYLTKPFQSIKQLIAQVNELMDAASPVESGAVMEEPTPVEPAPVIEGAAAHQESYANDIQPHDAAELEPKYFDDLGYETPAPAEETSYPAADDIDKLYEQSVAGDDLSDVGIDDEMIETSYSAPQANDELPAFASEPTIEPSSEAEVVEPERSDDPAAFAAGHESTSAEPNTEAVTEESQDEIGFRSGYEQRFPDDPSKFENTIAYENWQPADMRENTDDSATLHPIDTAPLSDPGHQPVESVAQNSPIGEDTIRMENRFDTTGSSFQFDDTDLLDLSANGQTQVEITSPVNAVEHGATKQIVTLSPELIEMIAQRVVEKLSEKY